MKKLVLGMSALALVLTGCGKQNADEAVVVDKGLTGVTIMMEPDYAGTVDASLAKDVEESANQLTYTMSHANYRKAMNEIDLQVQQSFTMVQMQYPAFTDILVNSSHTIADVKVDFTQFNDQLQTAFLAVASSLMYYQVFDGRSQEDFKAVINVYDAENDDLVETFHLPDDLY